MPKKSGHGPAAGLDREGRDEMPGRRGTSGPRTRPGGHGRRSSRSRRRCRWGRGVGEPGGEPGESATTMIAPRRLPGLRSHATIPAARSIRRRSRSNREPGGERRPAGSAAGRSARARGPRPRPPAPRARRRAPSTPCAGVAGSVRGRARWPDRRRPAARPRWDALGVSSPGGSWVDETDACALRCTTLRLTVQPGQAERAGPPGTRRVMIGPTRVGPRSATRGCAGPLLDGIACDHR